jgi:hypothetical protein
MHDVVQIGPAQQRAGDAARKPGPLDRVEKTQLRLLPARPRKIEAGQQAPIKTNLASTVLIETIAAPKDVDLMPGFDRVTTCLPSPPTWVPGRSSETIRIFTPSSSATKDL